MGAALVKMGSLFFLQIFFSGQAIERIKKDKIHFIPVRHFTFNFLHK